jgi:addiction module RelE/StbE family toxin
MTIRWMPLAEQDLEAAYEYVRQDNESAAKQLVAPIFSAVGMLTRYPLAGREGRVQGTRELAVVRTPYVVAYRIRQDVIQVLAILHGAHRWSAAFSPKQAL